MFISLLIYTILTFLFPTQSGNLNDLRKTEYGPSLSDNYIVSITEDRFGFIWLATREEIARFDGLSYTSIDNSIIEKVFSGRNVINEIKFTESDKMLICTSGGLFCADIQNNELVYYNALSGYPIYSVILLNSDKWALLNTGTGIILYNFQNDNIEFLDYSYNQKTDKTRNSAAIDPDGNIWLCEDNLIKLDVNEQFINNESCPEINELISGVTEYFHLDRRNDIAIDKFGNIWLYNSQDLMTLNIEKIEKGEKPKTIQNEITAIDFYENNVILGIRGKGSILIRRDNNGHVLDSVRISTNDYLDDLGNTINDYYYDDKYNIWIGTRDGLYCIEDNDTYSFKNISSSITNNNSLSHNTVNDVMIGENGVVWVATSYGLNKLEFDENMDYRIQNFLPVSGTETMSLSNKIECLIEVDPGIFWIGTKSDLLIFDSIKGTFHRNESTDVITGNSRFVRALCKDKYKNIWIGYQNGGVYYYDNNSKTTFKVPIIINGKILDDCTCISIDREGNTWVGTRKYGLIRVRSPFNPSESTSVYYPNVLSNSNNPVLITSIFVDLYNTVWCGTEEGLFKYNPRSNSFENVKISQLKTVPYISGIIDDNEGNLWISSDTGIFRYNPSEKSSKYIELYKKNFARKKFTFGMEKDNDGRIFCSGISGLTYFSPEEIEDVKYDINIMFTDFRIDNNSVLSNSNILDKDINETECIYIPRGNNNISFAFCVPGYINKDILYGYTLEGYDKDWIIMGYNPKYISYNSLPAGKYILKLRCSDNSGEWSDNIRSLEIIIRPPFILSWYMIFIYIIIFSGIFFIIIKVIHEKEERKKWQTINESRIKFYRDMFNELKTPYSILHTPLLKLKEDYSNLNKDQVISLLDSASKGSNLLYMQLEQLSVFCDIENSTLILNESEIDFISLIKNISESFKRLCISKNIELHFHTDIDELSMVCDVSKMDIIFSNILSNAFKYTPKNGKINIKCSIIPDEQIQISISDTGLGISPEDKDKILNPFSANGIYSGNTFIGLPLVKSMVELHNGSINIKDNDGAGSIFVLTFPIKTACSSADDIINELHNSILDDYIESINIDDSIVQQKRSEIDLIYVVEKDNNLRDMLNKLLSPDYRIEMFSDPNEVFENIYKDKPTLIISSAIFSGNMQGLEFCKEVKSSSYTNTVPFLFLTGYHNSDFERKAFEYGADGIIAKPFNMDYLMMRINQLIESRKYIKEKVRKDIITTPKELVIMSSEEKFLAQVKNILEKHIGDESFNINAFAASMNISVSLLHRKIKNLTNTTPNEYLKDFRLQRAAQLLKSKAFNVSEVSYKVGFSDVKYFSTCFKKKYGVTPSVYQKESE